MSDEAPLRRLSDGKEVHWVHDDFGDLIDPMNGIKYWTERVSVPEDGKERTLRTPQSLGLNLSILQIHGLRAENLFKALREMGYAFEAHWTEEERKRAPWV